MRPRLRRSRRARRGAGGAGRFTIGLLALAVIAAGVFLGFTKSLPFGDDHTVEAVFPTANDIRRDSPVRIAGVDVGKVTRIAHLDGGAQAAVVTMRIDRKGLPIRRDARMKIRPRIFLEGNFFVDVQPGSPSAPELEDGERIPIDQTSAPVQLDQILTDLQAPTRRDLQGLLREVSGGLEGEGAAGLNRSIPHWEPAYRDSSIVADALRGQVDRDLSRYVEHAGATAAALDRDPARLKALLTDFTTTARALAERDEALSQAVAELPRTLRAAEPALRTLNASFPAVRRLIRDARPGVRSSGPALDAGVPFTRQLRGLVSEPELRGLSRDLRPVVPSLARLNGGSVPLYEQVREAASCQNAVILPWSRDTIQDKAFPARGPVYQEATKPLPGLAGESRSGDANGQWFRVLLSAPKYAYPFGTDRFFLTGAPLQGVNPPVPQDHKRSPLRPEAPCETQEQPDLRTIPDAAPKGLELKTPTPGQVDAALQETVTFLRGRIEEQGLDLKVTDVPAKLEELQR
ncbi:MAG: phospholipid/cholesterol/gamma-HCH transport system substrate-binding protein [Solirubrobacteraceae bacterium]|nr:phospholipid/cholesterol/gamma-HCH transport system substrate-binding protein [Solirubrobacteraceae bacterium]